MQIKSRLRPRRSELTKKNTEQRITVKTVMSLLSFLRIWTDCRWYDFCTVLLSVRRGNDFRLFLAVEHFTKKRLNSPIPYYVQTDERLAAPLLSEPFTHGEIGVLMKKGQEDLLQIVNNTIQRMKSDGKLRRLHEKYGLIYAY